QAAAAVDRTGSKEAAIKEASATLERDPGDTFKQGIISYLQSGNTIPPLDKTGSLYRVDIDAEPEHFLDWDKPLSEQSQHVYESMRKGGLLTGDTLEDQMRRELTTRMNKHQLDEGPALQHWYNELHAQEKTADDDALDDIWDKQGVIQKWWDEGPPEGGSSGSDPTGQTYVRLLAERLGGAEQASQALHQAGIPGIRYLDQGSRAGG